MILWTLRGIFPILSLRFEMLDQGWPGVAVPVWADVVAPGVAVVDVAVAALVVAAPTTPAAAVAAVDAVAAADAVAAVDAAVDAAAANADVAAVDVGSTTTASVEFSGAAQATNHHRIP